jgi:hypothetical protein
MTDDRRFDMASLVCTPAAPDDGVGIEPPVLKFDAVDFNRVIA